MSRHPEAETGAGAEAGAEAEAAADAGFTLVEMLVAMTLFAVLGTVLLGFSLGSADVAERVRAGSNVTGEARVAASPDTVKKYIALGFEVVVEGGAGLGAVIPDSAFADAGAAIAADAAAAAAELGTAVVVKRISRELRQAEGVRDATVDDDGRIVAVTLEVDFDGNGVIDSSAVDPEVLTYRWLPDQERFTLTANDDVTRPVLAGGVVEADIRLRSSQWIHDADGDGTTTWQELDASSVGDDDGAPDAAELALVDLVSVELVVRDGATTRRFTAQADMRNRTGGTP